MLRVSASTMSMEYGVVQLPVNKAPTVITSVIIWVATSTGMGTTAPVTVDIDRSVSNMVTVDVGIIDDAGAAVTEASDDTPWSIMDDSASVQSLDRK